LLFKTPLKALDITLNLQRTAIGGFVFIKAFNLKCKRNLEFTNIVFGCSSLGGR